jgi:ABC-2 type transport system permease protein
VRTLSICASLLLAGLRCELQYRANFVVLVAMGLAWQGTGFVFVWVVLSQFPSLAGWGLGEVAFLYGLRLVLHSWSVLIFGRFFLLGWIIRSGEFDRYLLRPLSPFLQIVVERVRVNAFGDLLTGLVVFVAANELVRIDWSPLAVAYLALVIVGGCLLETALKLTMASLAFRFLGAGRAVFFVDSIISTFSGYPLKIFGGTLELLLTFVFPLAFVAYLPATVLLNRTGELSVSSTLAYLAPLVGALLFAAACWFWHRQLRAYQSAGH